LEGKDIVVTPLKRKMDVFEAMIREETFLKGRGQGNELSFFVFDYDPKDELIVRDFVKRLVRQAQQHVVNVQLFQAILNMFEAEVGLSALRELEDAEGTLALQDAMMPLLESDRLMRAIAKRATGADVLLLTGVGNLFPLMRSHTVLNRLHEWVSGVPVVLFFPGTYSGQKLMLFNLMDDDHYYRAFRIS